MISQGKQQRRARQTPAHDYKRQCDQPAGAPIISWSLVRTIRKWYSSFDTMTQRRTAATQPCRLAFSHETHHARLKGSAHQRHAGEHASPVTSDSCFSTNSTPKILPSRERPPHHPHPLPGILNPRPRNAILCIYVKVPKRVSPSDGPSVAGWFEVSFNSAPTICHVKRRTQQYGEAGKYMTALASNTSRTFTETLPPARSSRTRGKCKNLHVYKTAANTGWAMIHAIDNRSPKAMYHVHQHKHHRQQ